MIVNGKIMQIKKVYQVTSKPDGEKGGWVKETAS